MLREYWVMLFVAVGIVISIRIFINKSNVRKAIFGIMVTQFITWPFGLYMVATGKLEYPVRLFPKAIKSSTLWGYVLNPVVFAIYYIYYPKEAKFLYRCIYTILIAAIPLAISFFEDKYTNLVKYKTWNVYHLTVIVLIFYFILRKYLDWFFKNASRGGA